MQQAKKVSSIERIEIHRVSMPLIYPFRTAYGEDSAIEAVLVRIRSGDSWGWGESSPLRYPAYSPESAAGVFMTVRDFLAPLLLGKEISSGAELQEALSFVKGNFFAKGALDMAWWDLYARWRSEPLWKTVGGKNETVEVGADFGIMESIDALLAEIDGAARAGFKRVKLKYRPGWDIDMVAAVRGAFPDMVFHIDCNSAYTLADVGMFKELDRYGLAMFEQPLMFDDLIDHAKLQKQIETPICLDESITSPSKARKAIEVGACRWINIKPGRVGGTTNAIAIHDLCAEAGVPCWIGGMLESALGAAHCLALATLPNIKYPSDIFPSSRFYEKDLSAPELTYSGPSQMTAPSAPGVGAEPDAKRLKSLTVESARLEA
ncbi:MAG: o-succinylbenzoate synthase [Planctomycetia bacterium]|nr:o-succinylbenzoate synthase [Planctomycetia bacterium]